MLGLAKYYFPMFEEALDKYGCPLELRYLAVIESALNPNAVSRAGATGLWQFMYNTGKMYGLEVNTLVDDRRNPFLATDAAARHLKDLSNIFFNDWVLAMAAYNCGAGNVKKAIIRSGGKTDFWEIYNYLPRETRGYIPAFYGAWFAMQYYDKYDICDSQAKFGQVDTVHIEKKVHLQQISTVLNIPIEELNALNPQYKKNIIPLSNEVMTLTLPVEYINNFLILKDSIYNYNVDSFFSNSVIADNIFFLEKMKNKPGRIILTILFLIVGVGIGFYGWNRVGKYLSELNPENLAFLHDNSIASIAKLLLSMMVEVIVYYFASKYFKDLSYKLLPFAIIVLICALLSNGFVQGLKPFAARERYRATYYLDYNYNVIHNGFTPWYKLNGSSSDIVDALKSQGVDTAKTTFYSSFPSGHTCGISIVYSLMFIPFYLEKTNQMKYKWIFIVLPIFLTGLVGVSRMVMGAHYMSDVLFGGTSGFISALIGYIIVTAIFKKVKSK